MHADIAHLLAGTHSHTHTCTYITHALFAHYPHKSIKTILRTALMDNNEVKIVFIY